MRSLEERLANLEEIIERLWCEDCQVPRGSVLSDRDIKRLIEERIIKITPVPNLDIESEASDLGTCKVDLHLGHEVQYFDPAELTHIELSEPIPEEAVRTQNIGRGKKLTIHPGEMKIATTMENVILPECIIGRLEGKSGIARKATGAQAAPIFDAGWDGKPVLELHNLGRLPVVARYGVAICAMSFEHLSSQTLKPYKERVGSHFRTQDGARVQ